MSKMEAAHEITSPQSATSSPVPERRSQSSLDLFKHLNLDRFIEENLRIANEKLTHTNGSKNLVNRSNRNAASGDEDSCSEDSGQNLDSDCIDMESLELSPSERALIDIWTNAFYSSRQAVSLDFALQPRLVSLISGIQNHDHTTLNILKTCKAMMANFLLKPILRVVHFVKIIPDFAELDIQDQMNLLNGGTMEVFICSSSSLYDRISNKLVNIVSRENTSDGFGSQTVPDLNTTSAAPSLASIQMDILKMIWSEDLFEKTITFMKSMCDLRIDETTLVLILPLIIFSPDRIGLKNRSQICSIQSSYSFLLKKYLISKYGEAAHGGENIDYRDPIQLFNRLLLILVELRSLQEMHSLFLMDVDPANMDYNFN